MGYNAADGAALVAAAVDAAHRAGAPRRTVAAVAAAVAGTVLSAAAAPRQPATKPQVHTQEPPSATLEADNPEKLLASLRAVRRAQRLRKKQRRRDAKQAAGLSLSVAELPQPNADVKDDGAAGLCAEHVGAPAAAPAVPQSSLAAALAPQLREHDVRKLDRNRSRASDKAELADLGISIAGSQSNMTASDVASSGMPLRGQPRTFDPGKG
jgi:hypothetical protein